MSAFKKATKRITAVATSAAMVSSAVFGAGLSSYPGNFDSKVNVVVGSGADAMDTTSAESIIADLKAEFAGGTQWKVMASKSSSNGGDVIDATRSNEALNYGETIESVSESAGFDDGDSDVLEDEQFDNGISNEDYEQSITLKNGAFNYALRDEVDGVDEITDGVFYNSGDAFATYVLDLNSALDLSDTTDLDEDMVGEKLTIMGNEFTIASISADNKDLNKLELIGGANEISLGEGESTSVTVDGKTYEVKIDSVSTSEVLLSVNGKTATVDEYDTEDVSGISIAITDLVESSRDSVKGYATLVVGGQKITLHDGNQLVEINEEDIDDIYPEYEVTSDFSDGNTGMDTITITYKVDDDTLLTKGDSLDDVLFQAFSLVYDGTNDVEYETVEVRVNDDDITISGKTEQGEDFDRDFLHLVDKSGTSNMVYLKGDQDDDRIYYTNSDVDGSTVTFANDFDDSETDVTASISVNGGTAIDVSITPSGTDESVVATALANAIEAESDLDGFVKATAAGSVVTIVPTGAAYISVSSSVTGTGSSSDDNAVAQTVKTFDLTDSALHGSGFLLEEDSEEQYLYELNNVDTNNVGGTDDHEIDMEEFLRGDDEENIKDTEWDTKLGTTMDNTVESDDDEVGLTLADLGNTIAFANELLLELDAASERLVAADMSAGNYVTLDFQLDSADVDGDNTPEENDGITLSFGRDATDDEFDIKSVTELGAGDIVNAGLSDNEDGNSDVQTYVTKYGLMVEYDNEEETYAKIMVPDEQVEGKVNLVFGNVESESMTETYNSEADAEARAAELEDDGYTVEIEEVESEASDVEVSAVMLDTDGATEDMVVVGGPAINQAAATLLGLSFPAVGSASGLEEGQAMVEYFADSNSVLVYGWDAAGTKAAASSLNKGGLSGDSVNVQ